MEERKLNEKESLELIAQMIQNTKNRLETNCGMPFLFWGYTTIFVSLLVWFLVVTTRNYYWQYLWFLLPIIAGTGTYLSTRNQQPGIKTHLDKVINYIWLVFGINRLSDIHARHVFLATSHPIHGPSADGHGNYTNRSGDRL